MINRLVLGACDISRPGRPDFLVVSAHTRNGTSYRHLRRSRTTLLVHYTRTLSSWY